MKIVTFDQVKSKIIILRNKNLILDSDVAELYDVNTRRINEAVKNNLDKFPKGYVIELNSEEKFELVESFDRFNKLKHSTVTPKAFTEKGLYMLATILKSSKATQTTIAIIDAFAQLKELTQTVYQLSKVKDKKEQIAILENSVNIVANLLDNHLIMSQEETEIKIKLPFFEISKKITKVKK